MGLSFAGQFKTDVPGCFFKVEEKEKNKFTVTLYSPYNRVANGERITYLLHDPDGTHQFNFNDPQTDIVTSVVVDSPEQIINFLNEACDY